MHTGVLERAPIWTAFITHYIRDPSWASRDSRRVVLLADLQQSVFKTLYSPHKTSTGGFKLNFVESQGTAPVLVNLLYMLMISDAQEFMECLEEIRTIQRSVRKAETEEEPNEK